MTCLDTSWKAYVTKAGRPFREPAVRYFEEPADRVCGGDWPAQAAAFYCVERRTLVFPLTGGWIEGRDDLWLERGYRAVSPSACDTWRAPASRVA
ncbi:hypothetical protein [Nonomuraea sp. NPDC050783]|uniref:hypothetical protein n=1 Tax=Nonomuraea sp. NPDC050783 TaxID=3154634 RepID=UPI0034663FB3